MLSITVFQTTPSFAIKPSARNGAVVGKVTPSGSPAAASDGPCRLKRPFSAVRRSASVAVPWKLNFAPPTRASSLMGSAFTSASAAITGNTPVVWRSMRSGCLR